MTKTYKRIGNEVVRVVPVKPDTAAERSKPGVAK
jgi:hypothetical protein